MSSEGRNENNRACCLTLKAMYTLTDRIVEGFAWPGFMGYIPLSAYGPAMLEGSKGDGSPDT